MMDLSMQAEPSGMEGPILIGQLAYFFVFALLQYLIAKKLGEDNAWFAFIPILNLWLLVEMAGEDWWYMLLMFLPIANIFVYGYLWWQIADQRDKPPWIGLLCIIPCVNLFAMGFLAAGD